ncbi:sugar kinase [Marinitenerispora sediminis]|uniref:Carbohydrate kinase n=1 Tax=Marinitenerispora sediminis TaxID=1931232 RepID=A0A368TCA1_9ACTN|nr:sugar kinase [Marinitenerispora sediminis]RCV57970.1 carbohydrate kinase [Marinitenerispora sediminis]RCV62297.1 carbohydrate kinase [Marinitenerispora sediminis]RCV62571.1 carbohydrate kinase [Marinitenerispora sediminis]
MTPQVTCVGETMLLLTATEPVPLDRAPLLSMGIAGAESNVACALAALGHRAAWLSSVGDDPFGRVVVRSLRERGVDVSGVRIDPDRPTALFAKDPSPTGSAVHYYRAGSAASALGPELAGHPHVRAAGIVHLSGVTPALSPGCDALTESLLADPSLTVSFDVNHRPRLWRRREAAPRLLELARLADIVFVGRDEAEELWGTATARDVRSLLPDVDRLVVKDAEHGATEFHGGGEEYVPAPSVEVVEPVGAGDAFAAGYLAGRLRGLDGRRRLRLGHLCAGRVLRVVGDLADPPPAREVEELLEVPDDRWTDHASAAVAAVRGEGHE